MQVKKFTRTEAPYDTDLTTLQDTPKYIPVLQLRKMLATFPLDQGIQGAQ